jgi:hypothetical protein
LEICKNQLPSIESTDMTTDERAILERAWQYLTEERWVEPAVISISPIDVHLLDKLSHRADCAYRKIRISVAMDASRKLMILETIQDPADHAEAEQFLEGNWLIDITCSVNDIVEVSYPFVDLLIP